MYTDTTIITSEERLVEVIKEMTEMLKKESGKGINHDIKSITKQGYLGKNGSPIVRVIIEWRNDGV